MAAQTLPLTHYWPWDGDEQKAVCGASMSAIGARHSLLPTCPVCAAAQDATDTVERAVQLGVSLGRLLTQIGGR